MDHRIAGRIALGGIVAFVLAAVAVLGFGPVAHGQDAQPLATITAEVPTAGAWPLRAIVAGDSKAIEVRLEGQRLPTQVEVHLREPDGSPRTLWVAAVVPPGLEVGSDATFELWPSTGPAPGASLTPAVNWALFKGGGWRLTVEGWDGGVYLSDFAAQLQVVRYGAAEVVWRAQGPMLPVIPEATPELRLPHLGIVTLDVRAWSGVDAIDLRLLWEGGVVDSPDAWALFRSATLRGPGGADMRLLTPTRGAGQLVQGPTGALLPLAEIGQGPFGTLTHHAKLWSLGCAVPGRWDEVRPIFDGGGWGWAAGLWDLHDSPATAAGLPLPTLAGLPEPDVLAALHLFRGARMAGSPIDGSSLLPPWRHPSGIGYGGGTGGGGIEPWPGTAWVLADPPSAYALLTGRLESTLDRTRVSLVHLDGRTWDPGSAAAPFNFVVNPNGLGWAEWNGSWPSYSQDPLGFRNAQPAYRAATAEVQAAVLQADRIYGSHDMQHWCRGEAEVWPLAELYREPMALLLLERHAAAVRADFYEGGTGTPGQYTQTLRWLAARKGKGQDYARDVAWAGWHMGLAYAAGSDAQRARIRPWLDTWAEMLRDSLLPNGAFQVITNGKELSYAIESAPVVPGGPIVAPGTVPFYVAQAFQQMLVIAAALQVRGSYGGNLDVSLRSMVEGLCHTGWGPQRTEPDYRYAVGLPKLGGTVTALATRAAVEAAYCSTLHLHPQYPDGNLTHSWHLPLLFAAGELTGAQGAYPGARDRYLAGATMAQRAAAAVKAGASSLGNWLLVLGGGQ
jgi:hypothetical protein